MPKFGTKLRSFLSGEFWSWLFWKLAAAAVLPGLYLAVGLLTQQSGPLLVLGTGVALLVSVWALAGYEWLEYIQEARKALASGQPVPIMVRPRKRRGPPPQLEVEMHDGAEVVLVVKNIGGTGSVSAEGKLLAVHGAVQTRKHPYGLLWIDPDTHKTLKGHTHTLESGDKMIVPLAEYVMNRGPMAVSYTCYVRGDEQSVERFYLPEYSNNISFQIEVTLTPERSGGVFRAQYEMATDNKNKILQTKVLG